MLVEERIIVFKVGEGSGKKDGMALLLRKKAPCEPGVNWNTKMETSRQMMDWRRCICRASPTDREKTLKAPLDDAQDRPQIRDLDRMTGWIVPGYRLRKKQKT
jgi:hypothetical protein